MGLSAIVFLNGALQNGVNFSFSAKGSTIVFDIHVTEKVDANQDGRRTFERKNRTPLVDI